MVVGGLVHSTWVSVTWSRGHKLVANLEESFVLGAQSRPSDPNPNPMPVISAWMLCLVPGKALGRFGRLGCFGLERLQADRDATAVAWEKSINRLFEPLKIHASGRVRK